MNISDTEKNKYDDLIEWSLFCTFVFLFSVVSNTVKYSSFIPEGKVFSVGNTLQIDLTAPKYIPIQEEVGLTVYLKNKVNKEYDITLLLECVKVTNCISFKSEKNNTIFEGNLRKYTNEVHQKKILFPFLFNDLFKVISNSGLTLRPVTINFNGEIREKNYKVMSSCENNYNTMSSIEVYIYQFPCARRASKGAFSMMGIVLLALAKRRKLLVSFL